MFEKLNELSAIKKEYEKKIKEQGEAPIKEALKELFHKYSEIEGIRWHQYTPYFNDGDPCIFGLHGMYVKIKWEKEDTGDLEDGYRYAGGGPNEGRFGKDVGAFEEALDFNTDALQAVFGDHVQVTATRDKIDIEDYQHD